jgi:glycosyltransferase involved in cell wall biosynthesis
MRILHIIPYNELVPAKNGGALRCFHLAQEMSKFSELTILTYQPRSAFKNTELLNVEIVNPTPTKIANLFIRKLHHALSFRFWMRTMKGPADIVVLEFAPKLKELLRRKHYDVVVFEHLNSMLLGKICKRYSPKTIRIVDQHNVDHLLFKQEKGLQSKKNIKSYQRLKKLESNIHHYADFFFACSDKDKGLFEELNNNAIRGFVIPNGTKKVELSVFPNEKTNNKTLIFCGSLDYTPNINGLLWFYSKIWPQLIKAIPDIELTIIGRNGHHPHYESLKNAPGINFIGEVDDVTPYYHQNHIAIVPLLEGSGTRLKILEAMQMGNPVVSTTIGAEGIVVSHLKNILIADSANDFTNAIIKLLADNECSHTIAVNAKQMIAEYYVWDKIGELLKNTLANQMNAK